MRISFNGVVFVNLDIHGPNLGHDNIILRRLLMRRLPERSLGATVPDDQWPTPD